MTIRIPLKWMILILLLAVESAILYLFEVTRMSGAMFDGALGIL